MTLTRRGFITTGALAIVAAADPLKALALSPLPLKNGVDISWLPDVEAAGGHFYTAQGQRIDGIALLKVYGVKVGRIRVFVNPTTPNGNLDRAIALAKRLKAHSMEVCVDLHYSDDWADPGAQTTPIEWPTDIVDLQTQVATYTTATLQKFVKAGVIPQWVQIGNEISNGFLWPIGRITTGTDEEWQSFVALHNAATTSLRKVLPRAKSVIHLDCGADPNRVRWWFTNAMAHGLANFDLVGLSYYCQWQGSLDGLSQALQVVTTELKKPVLIAETAYPWTSQKFGNDVIDTSTAKLVGYPQSPLGQRDYVVYLKNLLRAQPGTLGVGLWWWEGLATRVQTSGSQDLWNGGMANSALVDTSGRALPALKAFNL